MCLSISLISDIFSYKYEKFDLKKHILLIYKWPQFLTLHAKSMCWEVKAYLLLHALLATTWQAAVPRTPMMSSHCTCLYCSRQKWIVTVRHHICQQAKLQKKSYDLS